MNADGLSQCRYGPIGAGLENAINFLVLDVDKFTVGRVVGLDTVDFAEAILYSGTRRGADPIVLADYYWVIRDGVAIGRPSQICGCAGRLVVFRDLASV